MGYRVIEFEIWVLDSAPQVAIFIFFQNVLAPRRVTNFQFLVDLRRRRSNFGRFRLVYSVFSILYLVFFAHRRRSKENAICDVVGTPQTRCRELVVLGR